MQSQIGISFLRFFYPDDSNKWILRPNWNGYSFQILQKSFQKMFFSELRLSIRLIYEFMHDAWSSWLLIWTEYSTQIYIKKDTGARSSGTLYTVNETINYLKVCRVQQWPFFFGNLYINVCLFVLTSIYTDSVFIATVEKTFVCVGKTFFSSWRGFWMPSSSILLKTI